MNRFYPFLWFGIAFLASCASPLMNQPSPTPTCYPQPQTTGEKYVAPVILATPPARLQPGQTLTIGFSGNYLITNNAIICAGTIVRYAHSDNLPGFIWEERTIEVRLDDRPLTTARCGYTCRVEVTMPRDLAAGTHKLIVRAPREAITFLVEADSTNRIPTATPTRPLGPEAATPTAESGTR